MEDRNCASFFRSDDDFDLAYRLFDVMCRRRARTAYQAELREADVAVWQAAFRSAGPKLGKGTPQSPVPRELPK